MGTLVKIVLLFILSQSMVLAQESITQTITVNINNLDNDKGVVYVSLYDSEHNFLNQGVRSASAKIENNKCNVVFSNVPQGVYAISLYHDENGNKKLDSNFLGIPKEDYGCSNNARGFMGPPKWNDAKFEVKNESIVQSITL
ncbi:DUF2141 domain-containing protein [Psychroserpens sp.]|uniref:DUF2141 domain-containing protein n=1 Tax=Psychroserpens sp. TaxID=2020870 RepID=UPI001B2769B2|nr:DUF2141 domain-containing protein [Psychroserpens sp.]MBO6606990.1 DUF2141 domain-containing protein [Psychroserpens sp.]MBO6630531.1 DUF2141 domain-containing protein [Psychroserpens sp.]MBO6654136.1 DUF2141 domain-containing protein [Psychroserpens sp.]MBO6682578.1 DUF2141 domain-containing protein [Psychroserpens sp.]MBO6750762.1 DUF2141 domain-containing protein [Psychroserpens sp.]